MKNDYGFDTKWYEKAVHYGNIIGNKYVYCSIQVTTVIVLFVILELGVRVFADPIIPVDINSQTMFTAEGQEPYFQYHPFAAFSWIPHAKFLSQSVNSSGFVSTRNIPFRKAPNELRVVTLGGSSTVGSGNVDEYTYPRVLEKLLQLEYPDRVVNVINAAAGGYSTIESLGYLQSRMIYYQPDVIVIMHGWNDMFYFTKSDEEMSQWRKDFNLQVMWNPDVALKVEDLMPRDLQYLSWSQLYLHLREFVRRKKLLGGADGANTVEKVYEKFESDEQGNIKQVLKPINSSAYDTYKSNLSQMAVLCRINGIKCYAVLQPTLVTEKIKSKDGKILQAMQLAEVYHGFSFKDHFQAFERIYDINREVFGDNVIDATELNGDVRFFFDHIHQNPYGTHMLAKMVFDKILDKSTIGD